MAFRIIGQVAKFPAYRNRCINMMPIIMGDHKSIPNPFRDYIPMINMCMQHKKEEMGKVGYLTIDEKYVQAGQSHRRGGLHVERSQALRWGSGWGGTKGGLFFSNNIDDSLCIYNHIMNPSRIGKLGSIEPRELKNKLAFQVPAHQLMWLTDLTPHESLPLLSSARRQMFRLVTSDVSIWYTKHNTKNPLGVQPGPLTEISNKDKFV